MDDASRSATSDERSEAERPAGVHLVGSVPLGSAEVVFDRLARALGDRLRRMPDGETGPRADWIAWQYPVFSSRPELVPGAPGGSSYRAMPQLRLRPGASMAAAMRFDDLGYAQAATASYELFAARKAAGEIPAACRFLVSLPTPLAPVSAFVAYEDQPRVEPVYEARMGAEIDRILAVVPAEELAVQWDARYEFAVLEGAMAVPYEDVRTGILERLLRLGRRVPHEVELGYHLCYGDEEHGHFVEPADARPLVEVANELARGLDRPLTWIHLPVPAERDDDAYYAPLADLDLAPGTELYLGLLHASDGEEGAWRRIAAARRYADGFGVATECGWGRGGVEAIDGLIALHRSVSAPVATG